MIEAENISYEAGGRLILRDVSVRVPGGEVTAVLGPNGAGKSTLMGCLTGSFRPRQGRVRMDGKPLEGYSLRELSRRRAVLSQANPINFPFTALEIVVLGRNPYTDTDAAGEDGEIARQALECVDAGHLQDRIFPTLSGGEQQRVHFARALAQLWECEGGYLFLDEPTTSLDLKHQHQLLKLVRDLARSRGFGVCVIMHDLNLTMRYALRAVLLKDGGVFAAGEVRETLTPGNIQSVFDVSAELALPG